jgi:hypothetical protein
MELIEPTPQLIREAIEQIKDPEVRMFTKCALTFGGRSVEFANKPCNGEKAYGTIGKGYAWIDEYHPAAVSTEEQTERLNQINSNPNMSMGQVMALMMMPPSPKKVAVFKIPIAKKHLLQGETVPYRHAAIPFDKKFEPWAEEIYNYYQQRGNEPLFPSNRKHYLDFIETRGCFKQFSYPVERYTVRIVLGKLAIIPENTQLKSPTNGIIYREYKKLKKSDDIAQYDTTPQHDHSFKLHGLRHVRTKELNEFYEIKDTLALCSFIGWAPARGANTMIARYGGIYQNWGAYIGNLFKPRRY